MTIISFMAGLVLGVTIIAFILDRLLFYLGRRKKE